MKDIFVTRVTYEITANNYTPVLQKSSHRVGSPFST